MKQVITTFTEPPSDLFLQALGNEAPEVDSNAVFPIGMLVERSRVGHSA